MISSSMPPKIAVVRIDSWIPKWVSTQTMANVASAKIHHGMFDAGRGLQRGRVR